MQAREHLPCVQVCFSCVISVAVGQPSLCNCAIAQEGFCCFQFLCLFNNMESEWFLSYCLRTYFFHSFPFSHTCMIILSPVTWYFFFPLHGRFFLPSHDISFSRNMIFLFPVTWSFFLPLHDISFSRYVVGLFYRCMSILSPVTWSHTHTHTHCIPSRHKADLVDWITPAAVVMGVIMVIVCVCVNVCECVWVFVWVCVSVPLCPCCVCSPLVSVLHHTLKG